MISRSHGLAAATTVCLVLTWASTAAANPTARLVYVRGEGADACPEEAEMRRAVAARLGYDPFRPIATTTLTAEVKREKGVYRGRVRLVDDAGVERGARDLESRANDCHDLTTAMALSMSIAIDPLSLTRAPVAEPAPVVPSAAEPDHEPGPTSPEPVKADAVAEPAPAVRAGAEAREPPPTPSADPPRFALGAGGHVAAGIAPAAAFGLRVSTDLVTQRWSVGLEGRFDLPAGAASSEGGRSRTSLAGGAFLPCVKVPLVWACGVILLSRVEAEAVEVSSPRADAFFFVGLGLRLQGVIELPEGFRVRLGGDVLGHPTPFELALNGRPVHRSSDVSALFGISLARIF
ncbi:MAG: hypothetical protein JST00_44655 [Deltaproteobacteria bacterium]|nr:hypothetical protein [Deltaproteobacteria bacterium]